MNDAHTPDPAFHSGFVGLVGRPNSGKSTLLNTVLGETLALVSSLPQTTRTPLRGIHTDERMQVVFVDTPGIHPGDHAFNEAMSARATALFADRGVDVLAWVIDLSRPPADEEDRIARAFERGTQRVLLVFNKADLCEDVPALLHRFNERYPFSESFERIVVSAHAPESKKTFCDALYPLVPPGAPLYGEDELTDAPMRFFAAEAIREQIIRNTREEVPHASFVEIVSYREIDGRHIIDANIHVETKGQRGIVVGKNGGGIKKINHFSARAVAALTGEPAKVVCHVKITPKWRDDRRFLREMGIEK